MPEDEGASPAATPDIASLLAALANAALPTPDRMAALALLKVAAFSPPRFEPHLAQFQQILRTNASDADPIVRHAALQTLSAHKDSYAQNLLIQGLQSPSAELVPPAVALRMLGEDIHAPTAQLARDVLMTSSDPDARAAAAGLLGGDPTAAGLLASLMMDKAEAAAVRRASAVSLRAIDSVAFAGAARAIIADSSDFREIRAVSRTALELFGDEDGGTA